MAHADPADGGETAADVDDENADSDGESVEKKKVTFSYPNWMDAAVENQLQYGDSKSAWLRETIRRRLRREGSLESFDPELDDDVVDKSEDEPENDASE